MKLGVDHYTIRSQGWNAFQILDYCAGLGLQVVHFSSLEPFERLDDGYLREVKAHAQGLGIALEAGMGSICPTSTSFRLEHGQDAAEQVRFMLHVAQVLGSPVLRCVLGSNADRHGPVPLETHIQATVDTCRAVREQAMELGIKLAIENHAGDLQGWELKELVERAGPEYVGVCIDTGNPIWVGEHPMTTLEHLAPYVVTSHIRDSVVWAHPEGAAWQWVTMGDGNIGIEAWARAFQERCPQSAFNLEIITGRPPRVLPFLKQEYWRAYPGQRAAEFARFLELVRNGLPFMGGMMIVDTQLENPAEYRAALVAQERFDLERSVRYCREVLGIGA